MGVLAAANHSSFARSDQSLLRSFSAIHRSPVDAGLPSPSPVRNYCSEDIDSSGSHVGIHQESLLKRDRRGKAIRSKGILRGSRRGSLASGSTYLTSGDVTSPLSSEVMPSLPFTKDGSLQHQRESLRENPDRKDQRRHTPVTVNMAQGMVTKLMRKKQYEKPHLMAVRVAEDNSYSIKPK